MEIRLFSFCFDIWKKKIIFVSYGNKRIGFAKAKIQRACKTNKIY